MKMIERYIDSLHEELNGAVEYAEYYIIYKNAHPQWARMYKEMAESELTHADYVRTMAQEFIDGLSWAPEEDHDKWHHAIDTYGAMVAKARAMLTK